jgi:polyhydroxybutyrate depolymerase
MNLKKTLFFMFSLLIAVSCTGPTDDSTPNVYGPEHPYLPPVRGMFHNISVDNFNGKYSVCIPDNFEPCSACVMILAPNGVSAQAFLESPTGQQWQRLASDRMIALVVVEPDAGQWNLTDEAGKRDDETYLKKVFDTTRSKAGTITGAFDMNERAFYLVGYEEGGIAAHEFGIKWPAIFCGLATIGGSAVPSGVIAKDGNDDSYPFAQADSLEGRNQSPPLPNKNIPVPIWIIESSTGENNSDVIDYWVAANQASTAVPNKYAQTVYGNGNRPERVWVTENQKASSITPEILYAEFLSNVQRFVGDPGGRLEWTIEHTNNGKTGFFYTETKIDGYIRRWFTFIPSSYTQGTPVPLVVAIHGYTSTITAFTGDSRWQDVAEDKGFIVAFVQAYPDAAMGNIPAPFWHHYGFPSGQPINDVSFIRQVIEITEKDYSVDTSRVYATGHSNGSGMTWKLALDIPEVFAACAPVGLQLGASSEDAPVPETLLPIWTCMGEYDIMDAAMISPGNSNGQSIAEWTARNKTAITSVDSYDPTGRFFIRSYQNSAGVPLYNFAEIKNSPHAYMPSQAKYIWDFFFSKFSRQNGEIYYNGTQVTNPYN